MNIKLIAIGKTDNKNLNALIEEYLKEIDGINCVGVFNNPIDFLLKRIPRLF